MRVLDRLRSPVEGASRVVLLDGAQQISYRTEWFLEKWSEEACAFARRNFGLPTKADISSAVLRTLGISPEEETVVLGNLMLNEGLAELLDLLIGAGGAVTAYSNANAQIGVGDSTTAEAASQTDLQASSNKLYKAMNGGYPQRSAQTMTWQSDFTSGEANFVWNEWGIRNGASRDKNLNRKVQSLGTKTTGTWTLSGSVTLS